MKTKDFLEQHDACSDGSAFALKYDSLAEAWDACERPDWLLWAYKRKVATPDEKQLRLFACWCVRQVWGPLSDERSRKAVEVAEALAHGRATEPELESARKDALYAAFANSTAYVAYVASTAYAEEAAYDASAYAACAYDASAYAAIRKAQASQMKTMLENPFR